MSEPNRKTLRSFYCRDYLWDLFEVMTRDLGCSMDYLINESMRHYARSRNYSLSGASQGSPSIPPTPPPHGVRPQAPPQAPSHAPPHAPPLPPAQPAGGFDHPTFSKMPAVRMSNQPAKPYAAPPQSQINHAPVMPSAYSQPSSLRFAPPPPPPPRAPAPAAQQRAFSPPPPPPPAVAAAPPPLPAPAPHQVDEKPRLSLIFNNQSYPVGKDKFIIGRGSTMTDLTIRDGNISRKHAAVIFRNGQWYIKDLDSTNGIDYRGNRIDSKKIENGDVFYICDYELRFAYQ